MANFLAQPEVLTMHYKKALEKVTEVLQEFAPQGTTARIYDYADGNSKQAQNSWAGIRVAEVSYFNDRGGCSFMQCDIPHGIAMCAQVERCLLALMEGWDMTETDERIGDGAEEFARLRWMLGQEVSNG